MKFIRGISFVFPLAIAAALASNTKIWKQDTAEDFEKGTPRDVTITSDGQLQLGPQVKKLYEASDPSFWAVAEDSKGRVFAAGGNNGKVYVYTDGKGTPIFEAPQIEVHALAVDGKDNLYVGTSPDGKVYRIAPDGSNKTFYSPGEKYIWSLTFDSHGNLYVGTGEGGKIFVVDTQGSGKLLFASQERHIRCLAIDSKGNVIAGSDNNGRIFRVSPDGHPTVLYDAPIGEITYVVVAEDGSIYAAGIGSKERKAPSVPQPQGMPDVPPEMLSAAGGEAVRAAIASAGAAASNLGQRMRTEAPGSEIYRIAPDGSPRRIWRAEKTTVFGLILGADGALLAGTGDKGAVYRIERDGVHSSILARLDPTQVTALLRSRVWPVYYAATSNLSRLFEIRSEYAHEGNYESQVYDAATFASWGRVTLRERVHVAGKVQIFTRSGNTDKPDNTWSDWSEANPKVTSPPARYIQWKLGLSVTDPKESPVIDAVELAYLPRNAAPLVESLTLQPPGVMYMAPPVAEMMQQGMPIAPMVPGGGESAAQAAGRPARRQPMQIPPRQMMKEGYRTITWTARDPNEDDLIYSVYIRGDGEKEWKLLKDRIEDSFYSWDTHTLPDGGYTLKLVASDERSNPPEMAERATRETARFDIDNTPPIITGITGESLGGGKVRLRFVATDSATPLSEACYAVDGGDRRPVLSVDGILDSESESFDVIIPAL
ncbi:MAG TPA: hypothetical protein VE398_23525, partial [Acidobacteriota bacterium]|nr:hypothetical protein [Acidobacteriota bacterium]